MTAAALNAHLSLGATDVARCWRLTRRDGLTLGFTDHDRDIAFDGVTHKADTGLTAAALSQTTGLSVDNTEAFGALSDAAIREEDITAGRYDGAVIEAWLVQWSDPSARELVFRGSLGEITRQGGAFTAELRGLSEALNQPTGQVYHTACSCILGDAKCGVDIGQPPYAIEVEADEVETARTFRLSGLDGFEPRWFEKGVLTVLSGAAEGLSGIIKNDRQPGGIRQVELWSPLGMAPEAGDRLRLVAGCDKRMETCRLKFDNILNFRGFPDIPGDDWLISHPGRAWVLNGGSRR
ncbi:DUF2163 domain-containing protein [Rhodobacterales bacterium HKCCE2091]|nr:DUF2163 domain-containing protein [Rhodobacterales bacterium HKCCE2091]